MNWTNTMTEVGMTQRTGEQKFIESWAISEGLDKSLSKKEFDELLNGTSVNNEIGKQNIIFMMRINFAKELRKLADWISPEIVSPIEG